AQPPSRHWKVNIQSRPRLKLASRHLGLSVGTLRSARRTIAVSSTSGFHLLLNSNTQPLGSTLAGFLYCQSPRNRISLDINQSAAAFMAGWSLGRPDSASATRTIAVSQTGEKHGSIQTLSSVSCSSFFS